MTRIRNAVLLALILSANLFAQIDFHDNFDDGNIDDWTVFDAIGFATGSPHGSVAFPDGAIQINSPEALDPALGAGAVILGRPDLVFTDFEMSVDVLSNDGDGGSLGVLSARAQSPFFTYLLGISTAFQDDPITPENSGKTGFFMTRLQGAEQQPLADQFLEIAEDTKLRIVFRGEGSQLTGQLFDLSDLSNPLATIAAEDDFYPSGFAELAAGAPTPFTDVAADITFDNFSLVATVPEASSGLIMTGLVAMAYATRRRRTAMAAKSQVCSV